MDTAASLLLPLVVPEVDRALALMDRDPTSPTHGSMDRPFWYYRTLTGFAGASWQQAMVGFAALYATDHPSNPYAGHSSVLSAAQAALAAWCRAQHRSGAFDEWYRNEHSYCPTAITGAGAVITLGLLGNEIDIALRRQALSAAQAAGSWLVQRFNPTVMNQNLASAVMLAGLSQVSGERAWLLHGQHVLERVARASSAEGWLPEYGGFDFGYSTLALDFLALASQYGLAELADPMAERLVKFLLEVTEPANAIPGRIGSRGTGHVFPAGAIAFARSSAASRRLAARFLDLHARGLAPRPADVDDRYFSYFYFPGFALAYREACLHGDAVIDVDDPVAGERQFEHPHSGMTGRRVKDTMVIMNRRLGGALALLREGAPPLYHLGYTLTGRDGRRYSSAAWREGEANAEAGVTDGFQSCATFARVSGGHPLVRWSLPFHLVEHLLLTSFVAERFQAIVKKIMVAPRATFPVELRRTIGFAPDSIVVRDQLVPAGSSAVVDVDVTASITMHSPSGRQDQGEVVTMDGATRRHLTAELIAGRPVSVSWIVPLGSINRAIQVQLEAAA